MKVADLNSLPDAKTNLPAMMGLKKTYPQSFCERVLLKRQQSALVRYQEDTANFLLPCQSFHNGLEANQEPAFP